MASDATQDAILAEEPTQIPPSTTIVSTSSNSTYPTGGTIVTFEATAIPPLMDVWPESQEERWATYLFSNFASPPIYNSHTLVASTNMTVAATVTPLPTDDWPESPEEIWVTHVFNAY